MEALLASLKFNLEDSFQLEDDNKDKNLLMCPLHSRIIIFWRMLIFIAQSKIDVDLPVIFI